MSMFNQIEAALVVLRKKGIYIEAPLYEFQTELFAKTKNGFLRLLPNGSTSDILVSWRDPFLPNGYIQTKGASLLYYPIPTPAAAE